MRAKYKPEFVRVFGREYEIHYLPKSKLTHNDLGSCENTDLQIYVEEGHADIEEADTVLHEVLHAICYTMKIDLEPDEEEKVVSTLATGLIGVFQDNPEFAKWLIKNKNPLD